MQSSRGLRLLSLAAWVGSAALIVLAGLLLVLGGGDSVDPARIDLDVERDIRNRTVGLGVVGLVGIAGAVAFGLGAWARIKAEEIDRRDTSAGFGVRPPRPPRPDRPADGAIHPPPPRPGSDPGIRPDRDHQNPDDSDPDDREQP